VVLADCDQIIPARRIRKYLTQHNKERAAEGARRVMGMTCSKLACRPASKCSAPTGRKQVQLLCYNDLAHAECMFRQVSRTCYERVCSLTPLCASHRSHTLKDLNEAFTNNH
jgi:hypothetical protein